MVEPLKNNFFAASLMLLTFDNSKVLKYSFFFGAPCLELCPLLCAPSVYMLITAKYGCPSFELSPIDIIYAQSLRCVRENSKIARSAFIKFCIALDWGLQKYFFWKEGKIHVLKYIFFLTFSLKVTK